MDVGQSRFETKRQHSMWIGLVVIFEHHLSGEMQQTSTVVVGVLGEMVQIFCLRQVWSLAFYIICTLSPPAGMNQTAVLASFAVVEWMGVHIMKYKLQQLNVTSVNLDGNSIERMVHSRYCDWKCGEGMLLGHLLSASFPSKERLVETYRAEVES